MYLCMYVNASQRQICFFINRWVQTFCCLCVVIFLVPQTFTSQTGGREDQYWKRGNHQKSKSLQNRRIVSRFVTYQLTFQASFPGKRPWERSFWYTNAGSFAEVLRMSEICCFSKHRLVCALFLFSFSRKTKNLTRFF